jgi:hypothetical protein
MSTASAYQGQANITDVDNGPPVAASSRTAMFTAWHIPTSSQQIASCARSASFSAEEAGPAGIDANPNTIASTAAVAATVLGLEV